MKAPVDLTLLKAYVSRLETKLSEIYKLADINGVVSDPVSYTIQAAEAAGLAGGIAEESICLIADIKKISTLSTGSKEQMESIMNLMKGKPIN